MHNIKIHVSSQYLATSSLVTRQRRYYVTTIFTWLGSSFGEQQIKNRISLVWLSQGINEKHGAQILTRLLQRE